MRKIFQYHSQLQLILLSNISILNKIGRPDGKAHQVVKFHTTNDIIRQMEKAHYDNSSYAKQIAERFRASTIKGTCRNIFRFIKTHIEYRIEPANIQTTKSLQRLFADGYGDCKHYSGLFAAILSSLGIKHNYRFVSYKDDKTPTHVYVVAYDENNKPIICDAVLTTFGDEKRYTNKIDKNMLMHLSGIGELDMIGAKKKPLKKVAAKIKAAAQKSAAKVKKAATKVKAAAKKVVKGVKKVGLAIPRSAFLGLVRLNVHGFGSKITKAISLSPSKIQNIWTKLGGDYNALRYSAAQGAKQKAIFGNQDQIGAAGAAAAAITAAAPIIIAILPVLKSILPAKDVAELEAVANSADAMFTKENGQPVSATQFAPQSEAGVSPSAAAAKDGSSVPTSSLTTDQAPSAEEKTSETHGIDTKTIMIIAGVGVAALFLLKKK